MGDFSTNFRRTRVKLIFNPASGDSSDTAVKLLDVISALQAWKFMPEAFLFEPGSDIPGIVKQAINEGIRLFVVCGGDGTIDVVAGALAGTHATMGIIPTGTQNNVALSLGIPADIPGAIAILRTGQRIKVDTGLVACGTIQQPFLEVCSVGLLSALYPAADDIQHGNLARVGDFLAALVASPVAEMNLILDGKRKVSTMGHVVLIANMPYIGPHFHVGTPASMKDGLLDVLLFADLSKIDLLNYVVQAARAIEGQDDERIQHYHVRRVDIATNPAMPVMADGMALGEGQLSIRVQRHTLRVMVGKLAPVLAADQA